MELDRRRFLIGAAGAAMAGLSRTSAFALREPELFAAARKDDRGNFSAALFSLKGDVQAIELPARGHDIALRPSTGDWVAFARRPGRFGVAVASDGKEPVWFSSREDRHFFGHGVFSAEGKLLYTTEFDFENARGMIGVRDATAGYRQIGEFSAFGMEPHDVALVSGGRTMVIANGGIRTHPGSGADELNIPTMQPSLNYIDIATGDLLEDVKLDASLHQLSIRHLAVAARDTIIFGCQFRGAADDHPPLVGIHRRGEQPVLLAAPDKVQSALVNYVGSVSADSAGEIVAASAPKGGLITYWDVASRRYLGSSELKDGCGVAPTRHAAGFLLTSGGGSLVEANVRDLAALERHDSAFEWDNHAILVR